MNNNTSEYAYRQDDEISLVDLAAVLIRRRRVLYVVFLVVTLAGLAYALLASEKYEYVSLIQIAEKGDGQPVESPPAVVATFDSRWVPEVWATYRAKNEKNVPFAVKISNPENTRLIRFNSEAAQDDSELVETLHSELITLLTQHQDRLLSREQKSLERRIESLDKVIEALEGQPDTGEALAGTIEKRVQLEGQQEQLKPVELLVVSRESAEKTAPKRSLIVVLAGLLGGAVGLFAVFVTEFIVRVRSQLRGDVLE